jgi:hypothetical protein
LRTDGIVEYLVRGGTRLGAGRAGRTGARVRGKDIRVRSGARSAGIGRASDAVEGHGGVTAQAGRTTGARTTGAHTAVLVNVTSLVSERAFAIQGTALARDEFTSLLLRHVLVAGAGVSTGSRRGAGADAGAGADIAAHVGHGIYVEGSLAPVQIMK